MYRQSVIILAYIVLLSSCSYLFLGAPVRQRHFIINRKLDCDNTSISKIKKDYYYYYRTGSVIKEEEREYVQYFRVKFYENCLIGFSETYIPWSIYDTTIIHNTLLKPEGYQWGMYHISNDSIYIEVRTRATNHFDFWKGVIYQDSIVITHDVDYLLNEIVRERPMVFKYVGNVPD